MGKGVKAATPNDWRVAEFTHFEKAAESVDCS